MPRKPRMYLPGVPCHVIQRGNNRQACFFGDDDYRCYLEYLSSACTRYGAELHAYVLMGNHTHLLITPTVQDAVSRIMQSVGRRYVQYVNHSYERTGTLWESRHRSSVIDADAYLLACYRYIELNPVRAGMVAHPADYPWSSYWHNARARRVPWIKEHVLYRQLGVTTEERCQRYRDLFSVALNSPDVSAIRKAVRFEMPLGNDRFKSNGTYLTPPGIET